MDGFDHKSQATDQPALLEAIADVANRRARGEVLPDEVVIAQYPHLMPELQAKLAALRRIHLSRLAARASSGGQSSSRLSGTRRGSTSGSTSGARADAGREVSIEGYTEIQEVSSGGQGRVFRAVQESTGRVVAIKLLPGGPLSGWRHRARFQREAEILARLNHPAIVGIIDRGRTADGSHFIVMDYVDGWCLDEYIEHCHSENPNDVRPIVRLFADIARAVDDAHRCGIVHRDLKPSNVRVDRAGRPHILDFGLARWVTPAGERARTVTETGEIVGSLPWASPEQISGRPGRLERRSDVYALGVMLYQALTGRFPYKVHGSLQEVIQGITQAVPAPASQIRDGARNLSCPALDGIVLKALAKIPEQRQASALALAEELETFLTGQAGISRLWAAARYQALVKGVRRFGPMAIGLLLCAVFVCFAARPRRVDVEPLAMVRNSIGMKLVLIPRGEFRMGSPLNEQGRLADEEECTAQHIEGVYMGATEVTQAQYKEIMGELPQQGWSGDTLPVDQITWDEAREFCRKLSELKEEKKAGRTYRLPTEKEWECACRAGTSGPFAGTGRLMDMGWFKENAENQLHPVRQKSPNAWGIYDMHGGVREWCEDVYVVPQSLTQPATRPASEALHPYLRVVRGGSIHLEDDRCRSASRGSLPIGYRFPDVGFRVVLVVQERQ